MKFRPVACAALGLLSVQQAVAGGFSIQESGALGRARGGAAVAGGGGPAGAFLNPANLAGAPASVSFDVGVWSVVGGVAEERGKEHEDRRTDGFPAVAAVLPITEDSNMVIVGSSFVPETNMAFFDGDFSAPARSRYGALSLKGSALVWNGLDLATAPIPWLSVSVGGRVLSGWFDVSTLVSTAPAILAPPEDPAWDTRVRLRSRSSPWLGGGWRVGAALEPMTWLRIGLVLESPVALNLPVRAQIQLPDNALFGPDAEVGGNGRLRMSFPATLRAGLELRPTADHRVEVAVIREGWAHADDLAFELQGTRLPEQAFLTGAFPALQMHMSRALRDRTDLRVGYEARIPTVSGTLIGLAGGALSGAAVEPRRLSVGNFDLPRRLLSCGLAWERPAWQISLAGVWILPQRVRVTPEVAEGELWNPVRIAQGSSPYLGMNAGTYRLEGFGFASQLEYRFGAVTRREWPSVTVR